MKANKREPFLKATLLGHKVPVVNLAVPADSAEGHFASLSKDRKIVLWKTKPSLVCSNLKAEGDITSIHYSSDGEFLASCSKTCISLWNNKNKVVFESRAFRNATKVRISDCNKNVVVADSQGKIHFVDVQTEKCSRKLYPHFSKIVDFRIMPEESLVVSCSKDNDVKVMDLRSEEVVWDINCGSANCLDVNRNNIFVGMSSGSMRVYEVDRRKLVQHYLLHDEVNSVSVHPNDRYLLSGGSEGKIKIVDLMEGVQIFTMMGHQGSVNAVEFDYSGKSFYSGGDDHHVMCWSFPEELFD